MIKKIFNKVRGFSPVELVIMVGFGALAAAALIYLGTTPNYMASSQPTDVNVNIKVDTVDTTAKKSSAISRVATTKALEETGNVLIVDAAGSGDYTTIQSAVDAAQSGDTIMVLAGTYAGAELKKPVKIIGSGDLTVINSGVGIGGGAYSAFYLPSTYNLTGSEISYFKIKCNSLNGLAIYARNQDNIKVSNLTIEDTQQGITNRAGSGWKISHNKILRSRSYQAGYEHAGILIVGQTNWDSNDEIKNNIIEFNDINMTNTENYGYSSYRFGIHLYVDPSNPTYIKNNKIVHNNVHVSGLNSYYTSLIFEDAMSYLGDPVRLRDNQVIGLNNFQISSGLGFYGLEVVFYPGNFGLTSPNLAEYNTFSPVLSDIPTPPDNAQGTGSYNSLNALL